jgi:DNA modification methylase
MEVTAAQPTGRKNEAPLLPFPDSRPSAELLRGDALEVLPTLPRASVDMAITSPPYWGQRQYDELGIGLEEAPQEYIDKLLAITAKLYVALKPTGSFWLNIGDALRWLRLFGQILRFDKWIVCRG